MYSRAQTVFRTWGGEGEGRSQGERCVVRGAIGIKEIEKEMLCEVPF